MDASRILALLLLLPCIFGAALCLDDRPGLHFGRHNRRVSLNEYLVPPPPPSPPRPHPHIRTGRVVNPRPTETPGYFSNFMRWLNPFNLGGSAAPPSVSPPHFEIPFPPPANYLPQQPPQGPPLNLPLPGPTLNLPPATPPPGPHLPVYDAPPPPSYDRQPEFLSQGNNPRGYLPPNKGKNCNPCNRAPWVPMQTGDIHPGNGAERPSYGAPPLLPPSTDFQTSHDVRYAASQEVRVPDSSQLPLAEDGPVPGPLPNPHLYPGPMPPLYKPEPFGRPSNAPKFLEPPPLHGIGTNYPPDPTVPQEYGPPVGNKQEFSGVSSYEHRDLASSGTQANHDHVNGAPQNQGPGINRLPLDYDGSFGASVPDNYDPGSGVNNNKGYKRPLDSSLPKHELDSPQSHLGQDYYPSFTSFGASDIGNQNFVNPGLDQSPLGSNEQRYPGSFGSNSEVNNILGPLTQDQRPSGSYGSSSFGNQVPPDNNNPNEQHTEDLSSSGSVAERSHVTVQPSIASSSSSSVESPIHFEESPLLDLTRKDESRKDEKWSASTVNSLIGLGESFEDTAKTTAQYHEFHSSLDQLQSLNNALQSSVSAESNFSQSESSERKNHDSLETYEDNHQDISYIPPSNQLGYLWPGLLSTTLKPTDAYRHPSDTVLRDGKSKVELRETEPDTNAKDLNKTNQPQQSVKRTKQVQVIIPYTSDYTPLPFHQTQDWSAKGSAERTQPRNIPYFSDSNHDNYVSQESRSEIRVVSRPDLQNNFSASNNLDVSPTTALQTDHLTKSIATKANNSIDVHRLQKNIDNWTIQEYSRTLTSSTILPSSAHPYLLPSKKIPSEYLTTTEPGDHVHGEKGRESVKTYSLAGFSFNDLEHEGSASNQVEGARVQVIRVEEPKTKSDSSGNASASPLEDEASWMEFSVTYSPVNKERVYVVTPQTVTTTTTDSAFERSREKEKDGGSQKHSRKESATSTRKGKNKESDFEAIERAYQVLPHAVNNLAVASTGKESVPLWGIMEHEEFASLNLENAEDSDTEVIDGPVLYAGHSKVSRGKR